MYISISLSSYLYLLFVIISLSLFTPQNYKIISILPKSLFNTYFFFSHPFHFSCGERGVGTAMTMQQTERIGTDGDAGIRRQTSGHTGGDVGVFFSYRVHDYGVCEG
jgi:hypothetical protein